jgi:predicted house-cleaning noncanonical NTP pyrophosphatase (MazG superfamily)
MPTKFDKLVRDEIPESIEANGETPVVHTASDEEYERRLHEKLREEKAEERGRFADRIVLERVE